MTAPKERKHERFKVNPLSIAQVETVPGGAGIFEPNLSALIVNESLKGCSLVALAHQDLKAGKHIRVQVGNVGPVQAIIRWREQPGLDLVKIGCEYVE